jgi:sterol 3beta-glucosyltransferase
MPSKHFVCLTIGSRGDVQPYIALGKGLQKEGHKVTIVTHEEYKEWVTGFGVGHRTAGGDPTALMKLSVENKMFSPQFFKESLSNFRTWLDDLLVDSWEQCKDADVLLESPSAMAGIHIAEALSIPYFRTFTMPWTKTRQFPHAFLSPPVEAPTFNAASYVLFDNVLWTATSSQINRWRKQTLGISSTDMGHLAQSKIPFIYNFSQFVVPKPLDWGDATAISGYWFLDNPELNWTPPKTLDDFMVKARSDGKPLVYIGFGSITVPNPKLVTERLIRAVLKSDVRAIISKGWSARGSKSKDEDEVAFPEECYSLDRVPHDWLFPQLDAVLHHGGAGTTGASLRAGCPTLIHPWFGDQFFWASRVQKLGAGLRVSSLHSTEVANALKKATSNHIMKEKAAAVGQGIRSEDGVHTAIAQIYTYLPRAGRDRKSIQN